MTTKPTSHDDYFALCSEPARERLLHIQREIERLIPDAVRCIGYSMPAFKHKRIFFYFAAFKNHIGVYPPLNDDAALMAETKAFRGPKGNLSFPMNQELPVELIGRVALALAAQYANLAVSAQTQSARKS